MSQSLKTCSLILFIIILVLGCNQATTTDATAADTTVAAADAVKDVAADTADAASTASGSFANDEDKFGYALGAFLAGQLDQVLEQQGTNINRASAIKGLTDVLNKNDLQMTEAEIQSTLQEAQTRQQAQSQAEGAENAAAGAAYLAANKAKEGWVETASGLQYNTVTEGTGASPTAEQTVKVHYKGTLTDGTQFDSSYDRGEPIEFPLSGVIPGWTEGVQLMKVGGKTDFVIPSDMAYGPQGRPGIPPNSVLLFTVELLEIK